MNTSNRGRVNRIFSSLGFRLWAPPAVGTLLTLLIIAILFVTNNVSPVTLIILALLALVAVFVGSWMINRQVVRPLRELRKGAATLASGQLAHRIDIQTGDEIETLASEFNVMAENLQRSQRQLATFAQDKVRQAEEAQMRLRELSLIAENTRTISASLDLHVTLNAILASVREVVPYDVAEICLWDPEESVLRTRAQVADPGHSPYGSEPGGVYTLEEGLTGWVARHGEPLLIDDLQKETPAKPKADPSQFPIRAYAGVPLMLGEELVGTLELASYTPGMFKPANVATLQVVAAQAAVAIQNARLFQETRQRAEEMTALRDAAIETASQVDQAHVLNSIVKRATELLRGQGGALYRVEAEKQSLSLLVSYRLQSELTRARLEFGEGVSGQVAQKRQPLIVNDYHTWEGRVTPRSEIPFTAVIGVPLIWQDELIGVINVLAGGARRFNEDDLRLLTLFASQAAVALQTANLYQQLVRRVEETSALRETAIDVVSELDADRLLETIVRRAVALLHARGGSLHRYNPEDGSSKLVVSHNMERDHRGAVLRRGEGLVGHVMETLQPLVVGDYQSWSGRAQQFAESDLSAMLGVPLTWQDQKLGALVVFADAQERSFDLGDVRMLTMFAAQASVSIKNADLYQETHRRVAELGTLTDIGRAISAALDLPTLMDIVAEQTARVMYAQKLYLALYHPEINELEFVLDTRPDMPRSGRRRPMGKGLSEYVITTRRPLFVRGNVLSQMSGLGIDLIGFPTAAWIGVPLVAGERVLGVLSVQHYTDPDAYDASHVELLQSIANQVAIALENIRLFAEARRRVNELDTLSDIGRALSSTLNTDELLQVIYQQTQRVMDTQNLYVALYDPATQEVNFAFYMHEGKPHPQPKRRGARGLTEHVILTGRPLLLKGDLTAQIRALGIEVIGPPSQIWMGVPMMAGQRVVGMISVQHYQDPYAYDEHHLGLLQGIANQSAIALENARLFAETRRRVAELATLTDIGRALSSTLKMDELLRLVHQQTQRVMHADNMFIALYDPMRDEIEFAFSVNRGEVEPGFRSSAREGLTGYVVQTRQTLFLRGNVNQFLAHQGIAALGPPSAAWLGVPLLVGERVLGALVVQHYEDAEAYDETHCGLLEAIASQAAIALDNARMYQLTDVRLQDRVEELTALASISRELNSTLHIPTISDLVLDGAVRATGAAYATIYRVNAENQALELLAARGYEGEAASVISLSEPGIIGRAVASGLPRVVDDVALQPDLPLARAARSALCVPINYAGAPVGIIGLESAQTAAFQPEDVNFVSALASQAAIAIGNALRYEEQMQRGELLRRRAEQLSNLCDISQAFRSNRPLDNVLEDVAHAIQETVGFNVIVISLIEGDPPVQRRVAAAGVPVTLFEAMKAARPPWSLLEPILRDEFRISQSYYFPMEKRSVLDHLQIFHTSQAPAGPRVPGRWHADDSLFLPLRGSAGHILGMISVDDPRDGRIPDRAMIETLELFANQSAVAIENNRLYTELEQRVEDRTKDLHLALDQLTAEHGRVETLYRVTSELSASLDLDRVLNRALMLVAESLGAPRGSILLVDSQTDQLIHRAALGRKPPLPPGGMATPYRRGEGLAGWVIQRQRPVIVKDIQADDRWVPRMDTTTSDFRSALAVPLMSSEDVLGVLITYHPKSDYFTQDHLRLVEAAARQVATAINNAELYRLIREQAERLGSMLRAQQEEASKSAAILEAVADGVIVANAQGRVVLFNVAAERILSAKRDEIVGRPLDDLLGLYGAAGLSWIGQVHHWLVSPDARAEVPSVEQRLQFENHFVTVHVAPVTMGEEYLGTVSIFRDVTKEVEVDRAKTEFVSTVSHELRTPMTSIKGYADLMLLGAAGVMNEDQKRFLSIIKANADRLSGLVNDLLDISRIEGGRVELDVKPLRLEGIVDQVANTLRGKIEEKGLELFINLASDLPMVTGDRDRVIQVLTNLVSNAYQYTKPGGTITVSARRLPATNVVQTDVSDTGIGIAPEDQRKVFERFFRADDPDVQEFSGTGLGLAIVKSLVEMLHGQIWLESQAGKGTTFSFTLPVSEEAATEEIQAPVAPQTISFSRKNGNQRHVLVVEDDQSIAQLISHHLREGGYSVSLAASANDALQAARREQPDLITLDIYLPGADGFEVLQTLKSDEVTADIPVVIVSVLPDKKQGLRLGAVDYMTKPIDERLLLETVERILLGTGKVLVVDDDRDTLDLLRQALTSQGFKVRTTGSGRRAMQLVREDRPDLILLDLKLPGGLDGYQMLTQLKQSEDTANIPVIVITGSVTAEDVKRQKVLALGADRFLTKPFEIDDLIGEIRHFLGESQIVGQ